MLYLRLFWIVLMHTLILGFELDPENKASGLNILNNGSHQSYKKLDFYPIPSHYSNKLINSREQYKKPAQRTSHISHILHKKSKKIKAILARIIIDIVNLLDDTKCNDIPNKLASPFLIWVPTIIATIIELIVKAK